MKKYLWREGAPFHKKDTQRIGEFIDTFSVKTPKNILNRSNNRNSPLYKYIEWDDSKAGYLYRLQQVKNIVNHILIRISSDDRKIPMRAFISVTSDAIKGCQYVTLDTLASNEVLRKQVMDRAYRELESWRDRYEQYKELKKATLYIKKALDNNVRLGVVRRGAA